MTSCVDPRCGVVMAPSHDEPEGRREYVPMPLSFALRTIVARLFEELSPAERQELEDAAGLLDLAWPALGELVDRIEVCGASPELTHAVTLASDLMRAVGNQWNPRDKQAVERVLAALLED